MSVVLLREDPPGAVGGVPRYYDNLVKACGIVDVGINDSTLIDWKAGRLSISADNDLVIVTNQYACDIPPQYAVIAIQHGCAMEHGLANNYQPHIEMGARQLAAAQRERTYWVAVSEYAALHCKWHMGVDARRIIWGAVDTEAFHPGERQMHRNPQGKIVVLASATDDCKGRHLLDDVANALGDCFSVKNLVGVKPSEMPDALRSGDIFLSLSLEEGLPTVVQEALSVGLVVVGTRTGFLWSHAHGDPVYCGNRDAVAWANYDVGAVIFDPRLRDMAEWVADFIRGAWERRHRFNGRVFALRWFGLELFGRQWALAFAEAREELGVKP